MRFFSISFLLFISMHIYGQDSLSFLKSFPKELLMKKMDSSRINHNNGVYSDDEIILKSIKNPDSLPDGTYVLRSVRTHPEEILCSYKKGAVVVGYMSLENGMIDSFRIVKSMCPTLDSFAIEWVKFMPDIITYSVNDIPVKAYHERAILFVNETQKFKYPSEFKKIKPIIDENKDAEAIELMRPLIDKYPFNIDLIITLAKCYYKNGEKIKSYWYYKNAYDLGVVYGFTRLNTKEKISHILDNGFKSE